MSTTEYRNQIEPSNAGDVFRTLIFYEKSQFKKDFQTGKYLSDGPEERSFVASLADEVVVIAQCRLLQPDALPGGIEAYGKPVIQIDRVYEEPDYADAGAAEALISALPDVVQDLYGVIEVNRSEKFDRVKKIYFIDDTKNHTVRAIQVTEQIKKFLLIVKQRVGTSEFVFGGIHADTISSCIENKCKQAGVQYHGIHACRKTINSNMKHNGASCLMASSILGNTEEVNANYYSFDVSNDNE